jgi:hypothetical protein
MKIHNALEEITTCGNVKRVRIECAKMGGRRSIKL